MNSEILAEDLVNTNFISFYQSVNEDQRYIENCLWLFFSSLISIFLIAYLFKIINN